MNNPSDQILTSDMYRYITSFIEAAKDGFSTSEEEYSNIVEYEVDDGLFVGIDPDGGDDEDVLFNVYIYVADAQQYSDDTNAETEIYENPKISQLRKELYEATNNALANTDVDWMKVDEEMRRVVSNDYPSRYYILEVPKNAICA